MNDEIEIFPPISLKGGLAALNKRLKKKYMFGTDGQYFILIHEDIEFTGYLTEVQMYKTLDTMNRLLAFDSDEEELLK